jgi:SAM-dependent methyltransferase
MPQAHPHHTASDLHRPRVALLLVSPHQRLAVDESNWNGVDSPRLAWLIGHYTRVGDLILDLDRHPSVRQAAVYLHRRAATADPDTSVPERIHEAALVLAGPAHLDLGNLPRLVEALRGWHRLLRPGGFLLTVLPPAGAEGRRTSRRTTVITAARAAGLRYHQHLPVVLVPLPDDEPRTRANSAASIAPALLDGRHLPVHLDVLTFAASTLDEEHPHA